MRAEQREADVPPDVGVRPEERDGHDEPEAPTGPRARARGAGTVRPALGPVRLEQPEHGREEHRRERLGPDVRADAVGEHAQGGRDQRRQAPRAHAARRRPQDAEGCERREPAPGEQRRHAPGGPQPPGEEPEGPPRGRGVGCAVTGPGPEDLAREVARSRDDPAVREEEPQVGIVEPVAHGHDGAERGHGDREDGCGMPQRERGGRCGRDRIARSGGGPPTSCGSGAARIVASAAMAHAPHASTALPRVSNSGGRRASPAACRRTVPAPVPGGNESRQDPAWNWFRDLATRGGSKPWSLTRR